MKKEIRCEFLGLAGGHPDYVALVRRLESHPKLGPASGSVTRTSKVVRIDFERCLVETLNTLYRY